MKIKVSKTLYKILKDNLDEQNANSKYINSLIHQTLSYDNYINETLNNCFFEEDTKNYQGVVVNDEFVVYFSQILDPNLKTKSRNTFIAQNFFSIYNLSKQLNLQIKVSLNPINLLVLRKNNKNSFSPTADSIKTNMLEMNMLGVEFSKSLLLDSTVFGDNLESYLSIKNKMRKRNKNNDAMYISCGDSNTIDVYGTLDGAKWGNTFLSCALLKAKQKKWNIDYLNFVFYKKYTYKQKSNKIKTLKVLNYNIEDIAELTNNINVDKIAQENKDEIKRNQVVFRRNIEKEYNFKIECFTCDYNMKFNLISSHIHRVKDIVEEYKSNKINKEQAKKEIIDGINGFLLCPNHDKEFEKGMIYFDLNNYTFKINEGNSNIISSKNHNIIETIQKRLKNKKIELSNLELKKNQFEGYVAKHQERTNVFKDNING